MSIHKKILNMRLEIVVFCSGGIVMIFEIVGSRVLSPFIGNSTYVWTSLIGVILAALSLGYYLGGKLADKKADYKLLSLIIFLAGIFILTMNFMKVSVLTPFVYSEIDLRLATLYTGLVLFAPASVLLGMVSPYAVKLKLTSLDHTGATIGNIYALSTLGSIAGTFLAGFYLISYFGTTRILYILALSLILLSIFVSFEEILRLRLTIMLSLLVLIYLSGRVYGKPIGSNNFLDIDSQYNRILIYDAFHVGDGRPIRAMSLGKQSSSAMYLDNDDLVYDYTKYYDLFPQLHSLPVNTLLIGGAAYSYPKHFLTKYQDSTMDVVEIDPEVTKLATSYFNLDKNNPRLSIYHQDARNFLHKTDKKYDVVFMDAFDTPSSIPVHLTTFEALSNISDILNDDGVYLANVISGLEGDSAEFYASYYKTLNAVFPKVYVFPTRPESPKEVQNIIFVATKANTNLSLDSSDEKIKKMLDHLYTKNLPDDAIVLTDDFSPVERFTSKL